MADIEGDTVDRNKAFHNEEACATEGYIYISNTKIQSHPTSCEGI